MIQASWIDDGHTLLALDVNAQQWIAVGLDGKLVGEIADASEAAGEAPPAIYPEPARDGRTVAILRIGATGGIELIDTITERHTTIGAREYVFGFFAPGGRSFIGGAVPVDYAGALIRAQGVFGVFSRGSAACGDSVFKSDAISPDTACLLWRFSPDRGQQPGFVPSSGVDPWSPDGRHLLFVEETPCAPADDAMTPGHEPSAPCLPDRTFEVYSWPDHERVLTLEGGTDGEARWAGNDALYVRGTPDPKVGGTNDIVSLDGTSSRLPANIHGCCLSFSPDGRYVVMSAVAGEDCSLIDTATGKALADVPKGAGDTNDTGICQDVSWTPDGRYAIASGVSTP